MKHSSDLPWLGLALKGEISEGRNASESVALDARQKYLVRGSRMTISSNASC